MDNNILNIIVWCITIIFLFYLYIKIKKKILIVKDYNRKINKHDKKIKDELVILRKELISTEDVTKKNFILKQIENIVNNKIRKNV